MIAYMCSIIVNFFGFVNTFVGLDYLAGVVLVVAAFAFIFKLIHVKQL